MIKWMKEKFGFQEGDGVSLHYDHTRNGPRGPAGLGIPFAVDRMQNLVEILGQPFAEMLIWIPKSKNVA